jgi:hypothetical protein
VQSISSLSEAIERVALLWKSSFTSFIRRKDASNLFPVSIEGHFKSTGRSQIGGCVSWMSEHFCFTMLSQKLWCKGTGLTAKQLLTVAGSSSPHRKLQELCFLAAILPAAIF